MTIEEDLKNIGMRLQSIETKLDSMAREGRSAKIERHILWMGGIDATVLIASFSFGQSENATMRLAGVILTNIGLMLGAYIVGTLSGMGVFRFKRKKK